MKITFLGTAAATACPLVFCRCPACQEAWKRGGKDKRRRSSLLVNDNLLIDLGPDVMTAAFDFDIDVSRIRYCLQTHAHSDHFDAGHLVTRLSDYATKDTLPLDLCASRETLAHMTDRLNLEEPGISLLAKEGQEKLHMNTHPMQHGDTISLDKYRITAVESNHDPRDGSLLWVVEEGNAVFLYATDTMRFTENALSLFQERKWQFDAVAIDHTYGPGAKGFGHLCADEMIEEVTKLRTLGHLKENSRVLATHISHEGMPLHKELSAFASKHGYEVAYDGLSIEL